MNLEVLEISGSVNQLNYKVLGMYNYFILYFFYIRNSCITIYCRKRSISKCSKYVSYGLGHSGNSMIILCSNPPPKYLIIKKVITQVNE